MIKDLPDYPALQAIQNALWHISEVRGAAVMVGSGFSMNAELASPVSKAPPLWSQMASAMQQQLGAPPSEAQNPLRLAEEFRSLLGQAALDTLIQDMVPDLSWEPGKAHHRLLQLPWSDVLSTNWDTLLERTTNELIDPSYDIVYTPRDIARTRSPRIIKLHGTLPSHTPFIFTEEDYRTYPNKFAPFVNLAQHVLLENELLLLGFSGDDPNFLAWAGWVRDQLGTSARRIRLAGVLELSTARRRYLENLNVTPIDLAPLVKDIPDPMLRHSKATELLLESLHAAKPRPAHVWTRSKKIDDTLWTSQTPASRVEEVVKRWGQDREQAPTWLVAPYYERLFLRQETSEIAEKALEDFAQIDPLLRGRFVAELAWRLEISHFGVPNWARQALTDALLEPNHILSREERTRILTLLSYSAIEERDKISFQRWINVLENEKTYTSEAESWSAYLRALYARDWLNFTDIPPLLPKIAGTDPVWLLRRASLHCAICDIQTAAKLVRDALHDIRRKRILDRKSLWLLSRESWARFMWESLSFELCDDDENKDITNTTGWPAEYTAHGIDPWDQFNSLDREIQNNNERVRRYPSNEEAHFEAGVYRTVNAQTHFASADIPIELLVRRLADSVGLPVNAGFTSFLNSRLFNATLNSPQTDTALIWRVASYIRSDNDDFISRNFGRIQVAAMPINFVNELVNSLRQSIEFFADTLQENKSDYSSKVTKLSSFTEILSRLAVRCSPHLADELIKSAILMIELGKVEHCWLFKPIANLITRSLSTIPPSERATYVNLMLKFPLPSEHKTTGIERDWPEFSDEFFNTDIVVKRPIKEWDQRIGELIEWVSKGNINNRHPAISRLWLLYFKNCLTKTEKLSLAKALWSKRRSSNSLPSETRFLPAAYLQLPAPAPQMATEAFNHDVLQPLLNGTIIPGTLESIAYIGSEADKGRAKRPFSSSIASELIRQIPFSFDKERNKQISDALFYGLLPIAKLDTEIISKLRCHVEKDNTGSSLLFLPYIAKNDIRYEQQAITRLRRAMNSREREPVNQALLAVRRWSTIFPSNKFPPTLASATTSLVAMRRDPGLFRAIDVSIDLLRSELISEGDVTRLLDGLSELITETDYQNWRESDTFLTSTWTYVRANAYRLARALRQSGYSNSIIEDWIAAGVEDPIPEVRHVLDIYD